MNLFFSMEQYMIPLSDSVRGLKNWSHLTIVSLILSLKFSIEAPKESSNPAHISKNRSHRILNKRLYIIFL